MGLLTTLVLSVLSYGSVTAQSWTFVHDKTCEAHGYESIHDATTCKHAAKALNFGKGFKEDFTFYDRTTWTDPRRPVGCTWHPFGNVEQWYGTTADCNDWGYGGCYCTKKESQDPKHFVLYDSQRSWENAQTACQRHGYRDCNQWEICSKAGNLASWNSDAEWERIVNLHKKAGSTSTWVGLNDKKKEGEWRWSDKSSRDFCGSNCKNLPQWAPGEPNNHRHGIFRWGEECAEIRSSGGGYKLNDAECHVSRWFVCEYYFEGDDELRDLEDAVPFVLNPDGPVTEPRSPFVFDFAADPKGVAIVTLAAFNVVWMAIAVYYCCRCRQRNRGESYSKVVQFSEDERVN